MHTMAKNPYTLPTSDVRKLAMWLAGFITIAKIVYDIETRILYKEHAQYMENYNAFENFEPLYDTICLQFRVHKVLQYFMMYLVLRLITSGYKKSDNLSSCIVSMLVCWKCIITRDMRDVIDYYWYDLALALVRKDSLIILHHVISLYALQHCSDHPDYERIHIATVLMKTGDVVLHHYKITDALELYDKWPIGIRVYQMMTMSATIGLWIVFRVIMPMALYPFESYTFYVIAVGFHCFNVYWIYKMCILTKSIGEKIMKKSAAEDPERYPLASARHHIV